MEGSFLNLIRVKDTRDKIVTTLLLLLAYRLGFQIPIPGMDVSQIGASVGNQFFGMVSALTGSAIGQSTLFSLGIMPYISASIIFSMLGKISPAIEAIQKEGASGQKKINQWTRLAVVPIAILQGVFVYTGIFLRNPQMIDPAMQGHPVALGAIVIFSLLAGALLVMWIGELITEHGVGNGASLIIMAGIIATLPSAIMRIAEDSEFWQTILSLIAVWVITVFVVVYIHKGERRIPIQYARLTRGRRVYGGQRHYLPLKVNMAGVMPIIFASVLFVIPGLLFEWLGWVSLRDMFQDQTHVLHVTLYVLLVFAFCFFWNRLMFQPEEIANNLREHGAFIPGIRPGAKTSEYLSSTLTRITLAGAAFLAIIAVFPAFVTPRSLPDQSMVYFLGGTSVLIVVGVALELVDRLKAQAIMKGYKEEAGEPQGGGPNWSRKSRRGQAS